MSDRTILERKGDKLMASLNTGEVDNPALMIDDLLLVVFQDEVNKNWNKYNYILRNINVNKSNDSGLRPIRSAAQVAIYNNKYSQLELKNTILQMYNSIICNIEVALMHELCKQFKHIVLKTPNNPYEKYKRLITDISELKLLEYFMSLSAEELRLNVELSIHKFEWLKVGADHILSEFASMAGRTLYEANIISKASFEFKVSFIDKVLEDLNKLYDYRDTLLFTADEFRSVANNKRENI